jgi:hypothetical protein
MQSLVEVNVGKRKLVVRANNKLTQGRDVRPIKQAEQFDSWSHIASVPAQWHRATTSVSNPK